MGMATVFKYNIYNQSRNCVHVGAVMPYQRNVFSGHNGNFGVLQFFPHLAQKKNGSCNIFNLASFFYCNIAQ